MSEPGNQGNGGRTKPELAGLVGWGLLLAVAAVLLLVRLLGGGGGC